LNAFAISSKLKIPGIAYSVQDSGKKKIQGGGNIKIEFQYVWLQLFEICRVLPICFKASSTLCYGPRSSSSFNPIVSLAYLD